LCEQIPEIYLKYISKITSVGATTLHITTFTIMAFSMMTRSIRGLFVSLSVSDSHHK